MKNTPFNVSNTRERRKMKLIETKVSLDSDKEWRDKAGEYKSVLSVCRLEIKETVFIVKKESPRYDNTVADGLRSVQRFVQ